MAISLDKIPVMAGERVSAQSHRILVAILLGLGLLFMVKTYQSYDTTITPSLWPPKNGQLAVSLGKLFVEEEAAPVSPVKPLSKAIVSGCFGRTCQTAAWIQQNLPDWPLYLYAIDQPHPEYTNYSTKKSQGREAAAYLSYLVDHYPNFPDVVVFHHERRYQWHSEDRMYDSVPVIRDLNLPYVHRVGFTSLRCNHWPGCPAWFRPDISTQDPECWHPGCDSEWGNPDSPKLLLPKIEGEFARLFALFFPSEPIPARVGAPCCAQMAVSKEQLLKRSLDDYQRFLAWVFDDAHKDNHKDSFRIGGLMEHMWHIIFGQEAVYCPPAADCYCKTFGRCNLICPGDPICAGQYWRLPDRMPSLSGWPLLGQHEDGRPWEGWWNDIEAVEDNLRLGLTGL